MAPGLIIGSSFAIMRYMELDISKTYEPKAVEAKWVQRWLETGASHAVVDHAKKPFTIVIPPPNVTGSLHMGHALNNTLQDAIIRFRKMLGYNALWVPGTDHGGIATQNVVEKLLKAEGTNRGELGREKFLERMWKWRADTGDTILHQLSMLGSSLDWSRTRFTMDETCSKWVMKAFVQLYNKGLIYRGKRLVNWCPRCHTALSDIEVEHEEEVGKLWHIKYPLQNPINGRDHIVVATTRPETMLGDTAVAVHPGDARYGDVIGKNIMLPLMNRAIPIVADDAIDQTFGTGAVKVTPAHDPTDFDIALRQGLPQIVVIDFHGNMSPEAGSYAGLERYAARKKILEDLEAQGLLLETVKHPHSVGHCYRCDTVIEPLMSEQWFMKVQEMSRRAMNAVETKEVKIYPESWTRPYLLWLENLRDWCISRQIWWGHRIPVYYCVKNGERTDCPPVASETPVTTCPHCGNTTIEQDTDVLDTWFSSALWPFSVFGDNKEEREHFYPTNVLVTGHEILYLWVARMIQMGLEIQDKVPFTEVYIHGIVRDKHGKKMSKSLGNVIDPLTVMEKFGTDALRFSLAQSAAPGRDMQLSDESFLAARNFANKIWNASRFVMMSLEGSGVSKDEIEKLCPAELADRWILHEYQTAVLSVKEHLKSYNIDAAARELYDFIWSKYCDWYIEFAKVRMMGCDVTAKASVLSVLIEVLSGILRMLHPIMPFITEEIWQQFSKLTAAEPSIIKAGWPDVSKIQDFSAAHREMELVQSVITAVRVVRSEMNLSPAMMINVTMNIPESSRRDIITANIADIKRLAKIDQADIQANIQRPPLSSVAVVTGVDVYIPLSGLVDLEKEKQRLAKELDFVNNEVVRCTKNLANEGFISRAPAAEVEKIRVRLHEAKEKIARLKSNLDSLK